MTGMKPIETNIREYSEELPVEIFKSDNGRLIIRAFNEGGHNITEVDLLDLFLWLNANQSIISKEILND